MEDHLDFLTSLGVFGWIVLAVIVASVVLSFRKHKSKFTQDSSKVHQGKASRFTPPPSGGFF